MNTVNDLLHFMKDQTSLDLSLPIQVVLPHCGRTYEIRAFDVNHRGLVLITNPEPLEVKDNTNYDFY